MSTQGFHVFLFLNLYNIQSWGKFRAGDPYGNASDFYSPASPSPLIIR
jgi:hypothetical protein